MTPQLSGAASPANATYAKEVFARDTMKGLGYPQLHTRWVQVFINGLYWGVYLLSEKAEEDTLQTRFGAGNYYVWKDGAGEVVGDDVAYSPTVPKPSIVWSNLVQTTETLAGNSLQNPATYDSATYLSVSAQMNVDQFIHYALLHAFLGNFDAMTNNGRCYKKLPGDPISWLCYDVEVGADANGLNRNCFSTWLSLPPRNGAAIPQGPLNTEARLLSNLMHHPPFRLQFADRAWRLCLMPQELRENGSVDGYLTGDHDDEGASGRFKAAAQSFSPYQLLESLRWGTGYLGWRSAQPFTSTMDSVNYAAGSASSGGFFQNRRAVFQSQLENLGLLPTVPMPSLVQGTNLNTWVLTAPAGADLTTYYNPGGGGALDPNGEGLTKLGLSLASGTSVTLTAPYLLTARTFRDDAANTSAEDTPYWSALLYVNLPTHP